MKTQKKSKDNKKWIILSTAVALILISAGTAYALISPNFKPTDTQSNGSNTNDTSIPPKEEQIKNDAEDKADYIEEQEGVETPQPKPGAIEILTRNEGGSVIISTKLSNISSGTCTLTVTSNGSSISETAGIIYAPSYSTCAGFSIDTARLSGPQWNITVEASSDESTIKGTALHDL